MFDNASVGRDSASERDRIPAAVYRSELGSSDRPFDWIYLVRSLPGFMLGEIWVAPARTFDF